MILRLLPLLLAALLATSAAAQTSPLIMKHADSLAVARKRGTLLLQGRVHFIHDSIQFRTQRAFWNKNDESVQCSGGFLFNLGIFMFLGVVLFHLVTLPVELDASHRAVQQISEMGLVTPEHEVGVKKVLGAAALTYLGALVMAIANLLRILAIAGMNRRS